MSFIPTAFKKLVFIQICRRKKPVIKKDKSRNIEDIPTALANKHLLGANCMQNGANHFFNVESFLFINPYNL